MKFSTSSKESVDQTHAQLPSQDQPILMQADCPDQLMQNNTQFIRAMRNANPEVWDWNIDTDEVYFSPQWKAMLGYQEEELENHLSTLESLTSSDEWAALVKKAEQYITNRSGCFEVELRLRHKQGHYVWVRGSAFTLSNSAQSPPSHLMGFLVDITAQKKAESLNNWTAKILEMIAKGASAARVYTEIALMYESRHQGLRCSMLELDGDTLLHGGAPSLPKAYCDAVHGLKNGPNIGSCGTSTYTGLRVLVEDIDTDPKWADIKHVALPFGMRSCWSEPIKSSTGKVLGAFGMYYNHPALPTKEESDDLTSAAMLAGILMERDHNQKRIQELAFKDPLTGFASRASLYIDLEAFISQSATNNHRFSLLYLDLDNFKDINDSLGHDIGDLHLQTIATQLESVCLPTHFIARLGGDEFCIVAKEASDTALASEIAARYLNAVSTPCYLSGRKHTQTSSIGIAFYPQDGSDLQSLLKAADTALYTAKDHGKNQYAFYSKLLTKEAEYRLKVEQHLREAIENQSLSLAYQPQIDLHTGTCVGVEALSRWQHPELGHVSPSDFISTAERIGMIQPLTELVLKTACTQAVNWQQQGLGSRRVAINISPNHFLDPDFIPLIKRVITETGIDASNLELEVIETVAQTEHKNLPVFAELKKLGVLLAIDDFGTGYSSFASLKHLKLDCIKIDKYFMDDLLTDKKTQLLVGSMIEMAHNLGCCVIAEGIETPGQVEILRELGCDLVQGYLFCKPTRPDGIAALLRNECEHDLI
ncbi:bifunctional diguanylate cyclase/phosphodiesterase [Photobacterium kagoshimensis]|uniref:bifunctional diguanylate cyclase/phosphodiesterase n=1 Tax=Photobacterium kagoshimensis TaxID=2910242 RepID=UPI003D09E5E4